MVTVVGQRTTWRTRDGIEWGTIASSASVPLILVIAFLVRLTLLVKAPSMIDGDEALVGIQAERIASGLDPVLPVFFYGQHYMGSFEAYIAAGVFRVIGPSVIALRLVPLVFALGFVYVTVALAQRIAGRRAAIVSGIVAAACPLFPAVWSLKARGGYIETLALGSTLLLLTHIILYGLHTHRTALGIEQSATSSRLLRWFAWGGLSGLLLWINPLSLSYIAASSIFLALVMFTRNRQGRQQNNVSMNSLMSIGAAAVGVVIGGLPLWWSNVTTHGATISELTQTSGGTNVPARVVSVIGFLLSGAAPKLIGAWEPWSIALGAGVGVIIFAVVIGGVGYAVSRWWRERTDGISVDGRPVAGTSLLFIFTLVASGIFCISGFGAAALNVYGFDAASRYTLPLMSVIPIFFGMILARLYDFRRALGIGLIGLVVAINLGSVVTADSQRIFQSEYWTKLPASQAPLQSFLVSHDIRSVWINHWAGYPLWFASNNAITTYDYFDEKIKGGTDRLPWAYDAVYRDANAAIVFVTKSNNPLPLTYLRDSWGLSPSVARVGPYLVLWNIPRHAIKAIAPKLSYAY